MERAVALGGVGCSRVLKSLLAADGDKRIELGVDPVDSFEVELCELERGDFSVPDEPRLLGRREERELHPGDRISVRPEIRSKPLLEPSSGVIDKGRRSEARGNV